MPAAEAPIAWSEGRYREVMDYCIQDCRLTARVWQVADSMESFQVVCTSRGRSVGEKSRSRTLTSGLGTLR